VEEATAVRTIAREARQSPISGLSAADLPRERLARHGPEALRDHELLAIVLGTGCSGRNVVQLAHELLAAHAREDLVGMDVAQLSRIRGIGAAKASGLVAAFELSRRALAKGMGSRPAVSCPADAIPFLTDIQDQRREFFVGLYLNARNQVIHKEVVSIGSLSASIVHPREVFLAAVQSAAASVVLAHNHPSGDVTPSQDDLELTRRLVQAGELMGVEVLDHLIVGRHDFLSLKERGLL
jgi:DNA repair protein RadC